MRKIRVKRCQLHHHFSPSRMCCWPPNKWAVVEMSPGYFLPYYVFNKLNRFRGATITCEECIDPDADSFLRVDPPQGRRLVVDGPNYIYSFYLIPGALLGIPADATDIFG